MLNIASVNMPKIKPETKVLIIKTLKSKSPAEVADIFNVSMLQVERIHKHYQETGDIHDRPRSGRPGKTTAGDNILLVRLSKSRPMSTASQLQEECTPVTAVSSRTVRRILARNGFHGRIAAQKPETTKKPHCIRQGSKPDGRLDRRKVAEFFFFRWIVSWAPSQVPQYCQQPSGARLDRRFTQKTVKLWGGKIMVWGYIQYGGAREICKVDGNIDSAKYDQILPPSTFPGLIFFNRMELLAIPQVPLWSFSGGRRSGSFKDGQHSLQIWILLSISGEESRRKLGGALGCLQGGLPCHPRRLHQQALRLSAKPDGNCSAGQRNHKIWIT